MKTSAFLIATLFAIAINTLAAESCLKVGLLGEFKRPTGSFSQPFGNEIKGGTKLGLAWLKKAYPNACIKFELIDIDNSIANIDGHIRKSAKSGIRYFIGLGTSDQALGARTALLETNSILITPTASSMSILEAPSRTVMMFPTNDTIAEALARELRRRGVSKILSIYASNNKYSEDMNHSFESAFRKRGGHLEAVSIRAGHIDLSEVISKLSATAFDHVFVPLFEMDAARTITEISRNGFEPVFVGTDAWGTYSTVIQSLVKTQKARAVVPLVYSPKNRTKSNTNLVEGFKEEFKRVPTDLAAFSFDAVTVVYHLNRVCGDRIDTKVAPDCIRKILPIATTTGQVISANGLALHRTVETEELTLGGQK